MQVERMLARRGRRGFAVTVALVAASVLVPGCAGGPDEEDSEPPDLHVIAPGEYHLVADGYTVLPDTIWLEAEVAGRDDWLCVGEIKPHLPEYHRFRYVARWGVKEDGTLHLVWGNDYSGIRVELRQVSNCEWAGFATSFWNFPTRPQPTFAARLECAED